MDLELVCSILDLQHELQTIVNDIIAWPADRFQSNSVFQPGFFSEVECGIPVKGLCVCLYTPVAEGEVSTIYVTYKISGVEGTLKGHSASVPSQTRERHVKPLSCRV